MIIKQPNLTVDAIVICAERSLILIKRKYNPYKGSWALPGGFVEYGETVEEAVMREVKEETGLEIDIMDLSGVYSAPDRDPRGHTVTLCYLAQKSGGELRADTDAKQAKCVKFEEALDLELSFDHKQIIKEGLKNLDLV